MPRVKESLRKLKPQAERYYRNLSPTKALIAGLANKYTEHFLRLKALPESERTKGIPIPLYTNQPIPPSQAVSIADPLHPQLIYSILHSTGRRDVVAQDLDGLSDLIRLAQDETGLYLVLKLDVDINEI